jgi:thiamine-phosphate pyrophosphorylase
MANAPNIRCRLCLVTPPAYEADAFAARLANALAAGDVASLIITAPVNDPGGLQRAAEALMPVAEARGVASLIHNDTRVAGRTKADGVHIDSGAADVTTALESLRNKKIVGAGGARGRDEALEMGEAEPDYLFFGRLDGDSADAIFPRSLELASWWSSVTIIPAIVMGGRALASVEEATANGIEFVALSAAVWDHPEGPGAAVANVAERLARLREAAA